MSSRTSSSGLSHKTAQQPASTPPIRVEEHLGLVMHIAKRYAGSYQVHDILDLEDLYQGGALGLLHAVEKFDARKGFRFSTYATWWIRWAIRQAIMHESRTIRLPTTIWPALQHLARAQAALWQQQQYEPSLDELAEVMQCEQELVLVLLHMQHELLSLEQPVYAEDEAITLGHTLEAPDDSEQREQRQEVVALLKHLSPRERQVIQTRYQLGQATNAEDIPLPYTEVSRQLGMTASLVKAMEEQALLKLRFWAERKLALVSNQSNLATQLSPPPCKQLPPCGGAEGSRAKREGRQHPGITTQQR